MDRAFFIAFCITAALVAAIPGGTAAAADTGITVHGTVTYQHTDGSIRPVRLAYFELWANNKTRKQNGVTSEQGTYSVFFRAERDSTVHLIVHAHGMEGGGGYAAKSPGMVTDGNAPYFFASDVHVAQAGSSFQLDLNISNTESVAPAFHSYDTLVQGYIFTHGWFGQVADERTVSIIWPSSQSSYDGTNIYLAEADGRNADVVLRAYGHRIAGISGFRYDLESLHVWDEDLRSYGGQRSDEAAARLAFTEGLAMCFAAAARNTGNPTYTGPAGAGINVNLETETAKQSSPGQFYPSMVACTLWDMLDDNDDPADDNDTLQVPVADIWNTLHTEKPKSMAEFWDAWFVKYGQRVAMRRIFRNHQMTFLPPGATIEVAASVPEAGFLLTEATSDPETGVAPAVISDLPGGIYNITWVKVTDYVSPPNDTQAVPDGGSISFTGEYRLPPDHANAEILQITATTVTIAVDEGENPPDTEYAIVLPYEGVEFWVNEDGLLVDKETWLTDEAWPMSMIRGLKPKTNYEIIIGARIPLITETFWVPSLTFTTSVAGDVDGDCRVNILDLIAIRRYLNMSSCSSPEAAMADLNGDGIVNIHDLILCRSNFGNSCE